MFNKFFSVPPISITESHKKDFLIRLLIVIFFMSTVKQFDVIKSATMQIVQYKIITRGIDVFVDFDLHPGIYTY